MEAENTTATLDDLLRYAPALKNLLKYWDVETLKSVSETSSDWWEITRDALEDKSQLIVKRTNYGIGQRKHSKRDYKIVSVDGSAALQNHILHAPHKIETLILYSLKVTEIRMFQFSAVQHLILQNCGVASGEYPGIKKLELKWVRTTVKALPEEMCCPQLEDLSIDIKYNAIINHEVVQKLLKLVRDHNTIKSFMIHSYTCQPFMDEALLCKNLTTLHLHQEYTMFIDATVEFYQKINTMAHLDCLSLRGFKTHNITRLNIHKFSRFQFGENCFIENDEEFVSWLQPTSTKMKSFRIKTVYVCTNKSPLSIINACFPNLVELQFTLNKYCNSQELIVLDSMEKLHWSFEYINGDLTDHIYAPKLREFTAYQKRLTPHMATGIIKCFPNLTFFRFEKTCDLVEIDLRALKMLMLGLVHCKRLEFTSIADFFHQTNQAVVEMLEFWTEHKSYFGDFRQLAKDEKPTAGRLVIQLHYTVYEFQKSV